MTLLQRVNAFIRRMNDRGIPIPLLRINGKATFTGTMTAISFATALAGQFGKFAGFLGGVDLTQANYLFLICLGAYLGRKMQGGKDGVQLEAPTQEPDSDKSQK